MCRFSVVIPARNEENYLPACLESVAVAATDFPGQVQRLVVVNRCTDRTEDIARAAGATIVREDARNLARIRNAGARAARGEVLCTLDADSRMSPNTFSAVERALTSGRYVGGGVPIRPERWSVGIAVTAAVLSVYLLATRTAGGLFWCWRRDFETIGGFNEELSSVEDIDFARRLRQHGRRSNRRFKVLWRAPITTSCRKFDRFGDWYLLKHPVTAWRLLRGRRQEEANLFYYDVER